MLWEPNSARINVEGLVEVQCVDVYQPADADSSHTTNSFSWSKGTPEMVFDLRRRRLEMADIPVNGTNLFTLRF